MALPGVRLNRLNQQLGRQPSSNANRMIYLGCSTSGTVNGLTFYGNSTALQAALDAGELVEEAAYTLSVAGGPVGVMTLPPTTRGGLSSVTKVGTGAGTLAVSGAPHKQISIACTTGGTLGTAKFTFQLDSGVASQPVTSAAGWSSSGYLVPGTYCTVVFTAGAYATDDTYAISTLGAVTHPSGTGPAVPTFAASPIDWYRPVVVITKAGALGTAQFTYSLDGNDENTSGAIVTTGGGTYALPGTGIVLTFTGSQTVDDRFSFTSAGPAANNSDLQAALSALQTTYLSAGESMVTVLGNLADASAWVTQCSTLATSGSALFQQGVFVRFFNGAPQLGTITGDGSGGVTVNATSSDAALQAARLSVNTAYVAACAGDEDVTSALSGLSFRRNNSWSSSARAAAVSASQSIGAVADGAVTGVTELYRDETVTPGLDAVGFITMRTYPGDVSSGTGLTGYYITNGHTMDSVVSDYYPLTNARVIDAACRIAKAAALPFVNSKIPTTTRDGNVGVITERKAQQIENIVEAKLLTGLVNVQPQEAVAVSVQIDRTHNILADSTLIMTVGVQPFGYAEEIYINIGLVPQATA